LGKGGALYRFLMSAPSTQPTPVSRPGIVSRPRPLSPHLQVYRLPLTAVLSISHRITGVVLSVGLLAIAALPPIAVWAPEWFTLFQPAFDTWPARILLCLWVYAICFHASHGVRHLIWDSLHGLEKRDLLRHNLIEIGVSILLAVATLSFLAGQGLTGSSPL
jgi:succinate dehydrogenase / fumarate reductase cytochrome b subunit